MLCDLFCDLVWPYVLLPNDSMYLYISDTLNYLAEHGVVDIVWSNDEKQLFIAYK
jgi:hypothetical protein